MKIIECPRDAMQGIDQFIPTDLKVKYLNSLLKVGFDTIDFGSFVSPKAIPQMKDTHEVVERLEMDQSSSQLLAIVANVRGAKDACAFPVINYLGYPLSLSETFQQRNTNRSIEEAFANVDEIQQLCKLHEKTLVVYLSMGFGNPYGDPYNPDYIRKFVERLDQLGIKIISLADTVGISDVEIIKMAFDSVISSFSHIEFGAHLHAQPKDILVKVAVAYDSGCRRFDGALKGFGGCPMAKDDLTGNMATEVMLQYFENQKLDTGLNLEALSEAMKMVDSVFSYH